MLPKVARLGAGLLGVTQLPDLFYQQGVA